MEKSMFEKTVDTERIEQLVNLFGNFDENIKEIEKKYSVLVTSHGSSIKVKGDAEKVLLAVRAIECLIAMINKGNFILTTILTFHNQNLLFGISNFFDCFIRKTIFFS